MARYVVELVFKNDERRLAARPAHREYLRRLLEDGKLVTAGPFADDRGALLIYEVRGEAELRDLLAADPYTDAEAYDVVAMREWTQVLP